MGFNDHQQPQGAYPNVAPGQAYAPQGYPGNNAYPPMEAGGTTPGNTAYPPTGTAGTAAGSSGVTAPGGYPAAAASGGYTAAPGGYPAAAATGPPDGHYIPEANKPQPPGYPNDAYPPTSYPPQGSAAGPATGYPVHNAARPGGFMNIFKPNTTGTTAGNDPNEPCRCSMGWVLFAIGWIFPISWMVATFLPFCTKSRNDRRAGLASSVMLIIYCILIIALAVTQSRRGGSYNSGRGGYYNNGYNYNG